MQQAARDQIQGEVRTKSIGFSRLGNLTTRKSSSTRGGSHDNSSDSKESQGVRMRIKTVARISQEFSNHVARISSYVEKVLHLLLWTDPRLSTIFVAACLSGALLLVIIPPSYIALLAGCYLMRPPSLRTNQSGIIMNLFSRLPDNSDIF